MLKKILCCLDYHPHLDLLPSLIVQIKEGCEVEGTGEKLGCEEDDSGEGEKKRWENLIPSKETSTCV